MLFAPTGPWNMRIDGATRSDGTPVQIDSTSASRVAALAKQIADKQAASVYPAIACEEYSSPLYRVAADAPRVKVTLDADGKWDTALQRALDADGGVPIPYYAKPAKGTDGHMTVYCEETDTLWEFWRARRNADGTWATSYGAVTNKASQQSYFTNTSWPGLTGTEGWRWGATATGLPVAAGMILPEELEAGEIPHAIALSLPTPKQGQYTWPAHRADGTSTLSTAVLEGSQLRIDPTYNLASAGMSPLTLMVATAVQKYGAIVRDKTNPNGTASMYAESPESAAISPYAKSGYNLLDGLSPWQTLLKFPWAKLQLLKMQVTNYTP